MGVGVGVGMGVGVEVVVAVAAGIVLVGCSPEVEQAKAPKIVITRGRRTIAFRNLRLVEKILIRGTLSSLT